MYIPFDKNFTNICREIIKMDKKIDEWASVSSCDMFQEGDFVGGFEASEKQFTFSYYLGKEEFWFQLPLEQVNSVCVGDITGIEGRPADK